jgi:hypothetical protein
MRSRLAGVAIAIVAAVVAPGCSMLAHRGAAGSAAEIGADAATPQALAAAVARQRSGVTSLRATGKLQVTVDARRGEEIRRNRFRASQAILVREPAAFRLEALTPFGVGYAVASDGRDLAVLIPSESVVYRGVADRETVAAATGVDATPADVTDLLLGRPPVPALDLDRAWVSHPGGAAAPADASGPVPPAVLLHATAQDDPDDLVVVGFATLPESGADLVPVLYERITWAGELVLRARFGGFETSPAGPFPTRVEIQAIDSEAVLTYGDFAVNPDIGASSFAIATPSGARELRLDAQTASVDDPS